MVSDFSMNNGTSNYLHEFSEIVTEARYLTATGLFSWGREARIKTANPPPKACWSMFPELLLL